MDLNVDFDFQEVEEDKKRAEQDGMALQGRKGKVEDLTITITSPTVSLTCPKLNLQNSNFLGGFQIFTQTIPTSHHQHSLIQTPLR